MLNIIRKTELKLGLAILVMVLFALAGANVVFAADNEDIISSADKNYVQIAPEKQISKSSVSRGQDAENNYLLKNAADSIWSMVTPNEALAASSLADCVDQCVKWNVVTQRCINWKGNASAECIATWSE